MRWAYLAVLALTLASCSAGGIAVSTPLQGQITVGSERDAQKASRSLLNRIDEAVAEVDNVESQLKRAVGPNKRAEREELQQQKQQLEEDIRKQLTEFLAYYPKVQAQGWQLQPFDDARYFYYSYRYKELLPKQASAS